jgi:hypothetical protein
VYRREQQFYLYIIVLSKMRLVLMVVYAIAKTVPVLFSVLLNEMARVNYCGCTLNNGAVLALSRYSGSSK